MVVYTSPQQNEKLDEKVHLFVVTHNNSFCFVRFAIANYLPYGQLIHVIHGPGLIVTARWPVQADALWSVFTTIYFQCKQAFVTHVQRSI